MEEKVKSFILQCIERARGDDLVRAQMAFYNFSSRQIIRTIKSPYKYNQDGNDANVLRIAEQAIAEAKEQVK